MLITEYLFGFDGFVKFIGVHEGFAFDFEDVDFAFAREPVEGCCADFEVLAGFFSGVVAFFFFAFRCFDVDFVYRFGDDGLEDVLDEPSNHIFL